MIANSDYSGGTQSISLFIWASHNLKRWVWNLQNSRKRRLQSQQQKENCDIWHVHAALFTLCVPPLSPGGYYTRGSTTGALRSCWHPVRCLTGTRSATGRESDPSALSCRWARRDTPSWTISHILKICTPQQWTHYYFIITLWNVLYTYAWPVLINCKCQQWQRQCVSELCWNWPTRLKT